MPNGYPGEVAGR